MTLFTRNLGVSAVLVALVALLMAPSSATAQNKSLALELGVPESVRVNSTVTLRALATDAWNGTPAVSRPVTFGVGDEYSLANGGRVFTSNAGIAALNWRFTQRGIFRVVAFVDNGAGYLSQRTTVFIRVY